MPEPPALAAQAFIMDRGQLYIAAGFARLSLLPRQLLPGGNPNCCCKATGIAAAAGSSYKNSNYINHLHPSTATSP